MKKSILFLSALMMGSILLYSCEDDDVPPEENEEEVITDVTLTFTPDGGGDAITALAEDPDGEGPDDLEVLGPIELAANTTYTLTIDLLNDIEGESITEEVEEEDEEHMFFFGWTDGIFSDPAGDGNIGAGNRADAVNYVDTDDDGNPLGLETTWTTGDAATGTFRVILKHQPDIKTDTSDSTDGETDTDLTWDITIQ